MFSLFLFASSASAGPWDREFGSMYMQAGVTYYASSESFTQGISTGLSYEALTTNIYAEIGLPARMTFMLDLPYIVATNTAPSGVRYSNNTFGDGRFELDVSLLDRIALSLGLQVKVPLYDSVADSDSGGVIDVDGRPWPATNFPDVGDDNVDLTPKLLYGYSFYPFPAWITTELGYRIRLDGFADGIYASLNAGMYVWRESLIVGLYSDGVVNVQKDADPTVQATREYLYLKGYLTITAAPWQPALGLTFSGGVIPVARNSSRGWDLGVSLAYSF
jgi:hypothetical protein